MLGDHKIKNTKSKCKHFDVVFLIYMITGEPKKVARVCAPKNLLLIFPVKFPYFQKFFFVPPQFFSAHPLSCGPKGVQLMAADVHTNAEVIELSANCVSCSQ